MVWVLAPPRYTLPFLCSFFSFLFVCSICLLSRDHFEGFGLLFSKNFFSPKTSLHFFLLLLLLLLLLLSFLLLLLVLLLVIFSSLSFFHLQSFIFSLSSSLFPSRFSAFFLPFFLSPSVFLLLLLPFLFLVFTSFFPNPFIRAPPFETHVAFIVWLLCCYFLTLLLVLLFDQKYFWVQVTSCKKKRCSFSKPLFAKI